MPPPKGTSLALRPTDVPPLQARNVATRWLELSEAGLCVMASHKFAVGDVVRAGIVHDASHFSFAALARVIFVEPSQIEQGLFVVDCEFVDPPAALRHCLRTTLEARADEAA